MVWNMRYAIKLYIRTEVFVKYNPLIIYFHPLNVVDTIYARNQIKS